MKTIVFLSDIHYNQGDKDIQGEGPVLNAFFEDLEKQLGQCPLSDRYCTILGDLVFTGNHIGIENFSKEFLPKLAKYVPMQNMAFIPGNHDINRTFIESCYAEIEKEEFELKEEQEDTFSHEWQQKKNLQNKFRYFDQLCNDVVKIENYNTIGYSHKISPEVSFYFLNSALYSHAGFGDEKDTRRLGIWLKGVHEWTFKNKNRSRILVMHHPLTELTEYAQREIEKMINAREISMVVSGHTHDYCEKIKTFESGTQCITAPPLYEQVNALNGYFIMHIDKNGPCDVVFREWSVVNRKFMTGTNLSGSDDGIVYLAKEETHVDSVEQELNKELVSALKVYGLKPTWNERLCLDKPLSMHNDKVETFDYIDILSTTKNVQIEAPKQFGLTCYGRYLSLKAWQNGKEPYMYHKATELNIHKIQDLLSEDAEFFGCTQNELRGWIIDDWGDDVDCSHKFFDKLHQLMPEMRLILLTHFQDQKAIEGVDSIASHEGYLQLYLQPLKRSEVRTIVHECNAFLQISNDDEVLERLLLDMQDMNEHRIPINCFQLLLAYHKQFEKRPINRYNVLKLVLQSLFDDSARLVYGDALEEDECAYILGHFSEYLLHNKKTSFTKEEFLQECNSFKKDNLLGTNEEELLRVLVDSQILSSERQGCYIIYSFRIVNWLYFFAAHAMHNNAAFMQYMIKEQRVFYFPEIIEYYTGIERQCDGLVAELLEELKATTQKVRNNLGIQVDFNPYVYYKWDINNVAKDKSQEELEEQVKRSKLPDEYKDMLADKTYDNVRPYIQDIGEVLDKYYVRNLMQLTRSSGRCLRNAYKIVPNKKMELLSAIMDAWKVIMDTIVLLSPALAYNGYGGIGGARFNLSDMFPKDFKECQQKIILMIPFNLMLWYKDDVFSDKLMPLFTSYQQQVSDKVMEKHIIALMVARSQPQNWRDYIQTYISGLDKNSYYLGDLSICLAHNYATTFMSDKGYRETLQAYKMCFAKHSLGIKNPTLQTIQKDILKKKELPKYNGEE